MGAAAEVTLRAAAVADAAALARLNRRARSAAMPWLREPHAEAAVAGWLAGVLIARHAVLVAEAATVVGYIGFGAAAGAGTAILDLYVDPDWQRGGVGRRLLRAAMAAAEPPVTLRCFARNHGARRFYEAEGFRAAGGGRDNEEAEPDILYAWEPAAGHPTTGANP